MSKPLDDLTPLVRSGPALECGECRSPIFTNDVYFLSRDDCSGNHPYCWLCGTSVMYHLGQLTADEQAAYPQYGPL